MQHRANETIPLAQTQIRFEFNGQRVDTPAKAVLRMLPSPRLVIKCDLDLHDFDVGLADFQQDYVTATIHDHKADFTVGQFTFPLGRDNILADMSLLPKREPISIHHTGDSLSSVEIRHSQLSRLSRRPGQNC